MGHVRVGGGRKPRPSHTQTHPIVLFSRKMKMTRKTCAPSAPAGPSTGRRGDGVASTPRPRPHPLTCPRATAMMSAPSTAPAAARAKARTSGRRPAPPPQPPQPPAPPTSTRPAGAPPAAPPPTGPRPRAPLSAGPPRLLGPGDGRLKDASWRNRPGRREAVC